MALKSEILPERLKVKRLEMVINTKNGIMTFGENNDYPDVTERIVLGSKTAKNCFKWLKSFILGLGFENPELNNIVVGSDEFGRELTLLSMLGKVSNDVSMHNGFDIHCGYNGVLDINNTKHIPFSYCRFSQTDNLGYTPFVEVRNNWKNFSFRNVKDRYEHTYYVFNKNKEVLKKQVEADGGIEKFRGTVFFGFFDNFYIYPISEFDPVLYDADSETQLSIWTNNNIRNGFTNKTIFVIGSDEEGNVEKSIVSMLGADGDTIAIVEGTADHEGKLSAESVLATKQIESNIDPKIFDSTIINLKNSIRQAVNIPAIITELDNASIGATSGEAFKQAVNVFNLITESYRQKLSTFFGELYSNFDNEILKNNNNWTIKPLTINEFITNVATAENN